MTSNNKNHPISHTWDGFAEAEPASDLQFCAPPGTRTPNPLNSSWDCTRFVDGARKLLLVRDSRVVAFASVLIADHPLALIEVRKEVRRSRPRDHEVGF